MSKLKQQVTRRRFVQGAAAGKKVEAIRVYKFLAGNDQPEYVRIAANRGLPTSAEKN